MLLIDGLNILRRCYEANPAPDSADKALAATRSAFASFRRALTEHPSSHALAAFDYGGSTWRHALYGRYRASRKPMPQELRDAIPAFLERLTQELGLQVVSIPNLEADDVLATAFLRWAELNAGPAIVVSTDKDLCTLIAQGALVRDHFKPQWRDAQWVQEKFGVQPALLADLLALMGDSSDDIPGVAGIGLKTAAKLLNEYGSLEALLSAAPSVKGKVGERLVAQADLARLSRRLVAFETTVPLGLTWKQLRTQVLRV